MNKRRPDLTFQHNLKNGRHGWLRLTPAYSVKVVRDILERQPPLSHVLDPFSGTGTTGLVCAEHNIPCTLLDINPFLIWLAQVKTANYALTELHNVRQSAAHIAQQVENGHDYPLWVPPLHNLERWWSEDRLRMLARLYAAIQRSYPQPAPERNLLLIAFCRVMIESSNAAFNHQSMSFKTVSETHQQMPLFSDSPDLSPLLNDFCETVESLAASAEQTLPGGVSPIMADARDIPQPEQPYDCVITSPPYPNRMSYVRELRPYMYWLGYLKESQDAGELDWQAIGGTWGIATSRLNAWEPSDAINLPPAVLPLSTEIGKKSPILANYVHKYFQDIAWHLRSLYPVLAQGARVYYVVGNSKFYDTLVPTEALYAALLEQEGFRGVKVEKIRKRNSKKELYEFIISARK